MCKHEDITQMIRDELVMYLMQIDIFRLLIRQK